jgi:hypothetical protein
MNGISKSNFFRGKMKRLKWSGFSLSKTSCCERKLKRKEKLIMNRKHFLAAVILLSLLVLGVQTAFALTTVQIDIKPDSDDNVINLGLQGVIPVAILSSTDFDATTVNADTVKLAGASVAVRGNSKKELAHVEDVNGDGLLDLFCKIDTENLDPGTIQDGIAYLTGETESGDSIQGSDTIQIVPPE